MDRGVGQATAHGSRLQSDTNVAQYGTVPETSILYTYAKFSVFTIAYI